MNKNFLPYKTFVSLVVVLISVICYIFYSRFGLGMHFTDNEVFQSLKPLLESSSLEIVAELPYPPGNVAVSSSGRVFFSFHPEYDPPMKVAELVPSDVGISHEFKPFPSVDVAKQVEVTSVLSLRLDDARNRLYILDYGFHGFQSPPALVGYQLADPNVPHSKDSLFQHYVFPSTVAGRGSMLNDMQISPDGTFIIIVDTSIVGYRPAIIVYSLEMQTSYRVLSSAKQLYGHSALMTIPTTPVVRHPESGSYEEDVEAGVSSVSQLRFPNLGPVGIKIHVDSLTLSRDGKILFFGALTGDAMFGLPIEELLRVTIRSHGDIGNNPAVVPGAGIVISGEANRNLTKAMSAVGISIGMSTHNTAAKTKFRRKPITDGMTSDFEGNIFFTACEHSAIGVLKLDKKKSGVEAAKDKKKRYHYRMVNLIQSTSLLRWPDGFSFGGSVGSNGLYITSSALHLKFQHHGHSNLTAAMSAYAPFHILKLPQHLISKHLYDMPSAGEFSVVSKLSGQ